MTELEPGTKIILDSGEVQIVLKNEYDKNGKYLGRHVIYESQLTPVFVNSLKVDLADNSGFKQYRDAMKKAGYDIEP